MKKLMIFTMLILSMSVILVGCMNTTASSSILADNYNDNADEDHPAIIKLYAPKETSKIVINYEIEKFRVYSEPKTNITTEKASEDMDFFEDKKETSGGDTYTDSYWDIESMQKHTHNIDLSDKFEYGIFEIGEIPSKIKIEVDGKVVPNTKLSNEELDLTSHIDKSKDWHEIKIIPSGICRVNASIITHIKE